MMHLYLDESGDLGFDFVNTKPSKFFTVAVLVVKGIQDNKKLSKAEKRKRERFCFSPTIR